MRNRDAVRTRDGRSTRASYRRRSLQWFLVEALLPFPGPRRGGTCTCSSTRGTCTPKTTTSASSTFGFDPLSGGVGTTTHEEDEEDEKGQEDETSDDGSNDDSGYRSSR